MSNMACITYVGLVIAATALPTYPQSSPSLDDRRNNTPVPSSTHPIAISNDVPVPLKQLTPNLLINRGHNQEIIFMGLANRDSQLVSADIDGHIVIWDTKTKREIYRTKMFIGDGPARGRGGIGISKDGKKVAFLKSNNSIDVFDFDKRAITNKINLREPSSALTFNYSGQILAATESGNIILIDPAYALNKTNEIYKSKQSTFIERLQRIASFIVTTKDSEFALVVSAMGDRITAIDLKTSKIIYTIESSDIKTIAVSPDSKSFAIAHNIGRITTFDLKNGDLKGNYRLKTWVRSLVFQDNENVVFGGIGREYLGSLDLATGMVNLRTTENGAFESIFITSDSNTIITGKQGGVISLFNSNSLNLITEFSGYAPPVTDFSLSKLEDKFLFVHSIDSEGPIVNSMNIWSVEFGVSSEMSFLAIASAPFFTNNDKSIDVAVNIANNESNYVRITIDPFDLKSYGSILYSSPRIFTCSNSQLVVSATYDYSKERYNIWTWQKPDAHLMLANQIINSKSWQIAEVCDRNDGSITMTVGGRFYKIGDNGKFEHIAYPLKIENRSPIIEPNLEVNYLASNSTSDILLVGGRLRNGDGSYYAILNRSKGYGIDQYISHNYNSTSAVLTPDGNRIIIVTNEGRIICFQINPHKVIYDLPAHDGKITKIRISTDGRIIYLASMDGTISVRLAESGRIIATLVPFTDGTWVVTDPEGRFDTADLESMPHLHWVMPDDPFTPVPLEAFMKDYYEPRLLARILAGETFKPVRALTSLNRTQPEVKITSVVPDASDPSLVRVTVSAAGATKSYLQGEGAASKEVARPTAVHDLRLFRDGQVVGYADGKLAEFGSGTFSRSFTVRLPRAKAGQDVVFSAYAFNDDRVKSETVRSTFKAPALSSSLASSKGRAYVISMGVNQHEDSAWNLGYAANDAHAVSQRVSADLRKNAQYAEVVPVVLASEGTTQQASKAALRAVLARLSGKPALPGDEAALQGVPGAELLRKAQPDDLVLISFAGHGFADDSGQFYLLPQDTGTGSGKQITPALKSKSIGSEELSLWLRDVDAGDMTMIVDACQSAASVQAEGFKPGPMGSRGLGQLSFDKGMRILAASQSDEFALEDQRLKHGLLTFSLINDGLEAFNADFEPKDKKIWLDEWLKYGVKRVPALAEEVKNGTVNVANRGPERGAVRVDGPAVATRTTGAVKPAQQPALFDFAKNRKTVVLGAQ